MELLRQLPSGAGWWIAGLLLGVVVVWRLALGVRRRLDRTGRRRRARHASRAEEQAGRMLETHGFEVVDDQVPCEWHVDVDDETRSFDLYADFLVERSGARYIAEVKTGESTPSLDHAATRRQLLEYRCAFDVDGILLVDMDGGRISEVDFE